MHKRLAAVLLLLMLLIVLPWQAAAAPHPTLRWGSQGESVRVAQRKLRAWGYYDGAIDGIYGPRMYRAVTWFQSKNGLAPDGIVGPNTWAALGEPAGPAPGRGASRADELELLARVVSAEAQGEPYEGQVAVGAVLLNRMRDPRFPSTLAGVVYQPDAFESVTIGTIYAAPTASAWRAAQDALNGWDPSGEALFFWNPNKPTGPWIWSRPIIKRIGNHVFAR